MPIPIRCEFLREIVRQSNGSIEAGPVAPATVYAVPRKAADDVREYFREVSSVETNPTFVAHLHDGRVFGSGTVISPDGLSIARDVSLDFGSPFEKHWLLGFDQFPPPVRLEGETAVVATTLGNGYCHWLLEEIPRLLAIAPDQCGTLISHANTPFGRDALRMSGFTGKVVAPGRRSHFVCDLLTVPSLIGEAGYPTLPVVEKLLAFTLPLQTNTFQPGERIYVSRENARRRRITNEAELWAGLQPRGFVKIHLEDLAWHEQIQAFRQARVIVSPHGAGLANMVFCSAGAQIVECFNRGYVDGYFWRLASVKRLDYHPVIASGPESLGHDTRANRADFAVDVAQIFAALD